MESVCTWKGEFQNVWDSFDTKENRRLEALWKVVQLANSQGEITAHAVDATVSTLHSLHKDGRVDEMLCLRRLAVICGLQAAKLELPREQCFGLPACASESVQEKYSRGTTVRRRLRKRSWRCERFLVPRTHLI